ncbi:MAG: hypothetical protein A2X18_06950 [Bacteroidetes bacterium GWF2_40_14]|nr:MAG: hypothetical protein A2X18_06950 [Bacteroidetes bacterium GWF2_40_14]
MIGALTACKNEPKSFSLTGTLEGITDGKAILMSIENRETPADTAIIENGKFAFKDTIAEPSLYYLMIEGKRSMTYFYAENAEMTVTGHVDSLNNAIFTGGKTQDDANILKNKTKELYEKYNLEELQKELYQRVDSLKATPEREAEITEIIKRYQEESRQLSENFIKENPKSYYSAILVGQLTSGKSATEIERYISMLDPKIAATARVTKMRQQTEEMKKTEVGIDSLITNAHDLAYMVDAAFAGKDHQEVIYLSILSNDNICALKSDGSVRIIDAKGTKVSEFKTKMTSKASAIAVDKSDNIYVFGTVMGKKKVEARGKTSEIDAPVGVECVVFNAKGVIVRELKLADIISATGARVAEGKIMVADTRTRMIAIYNAETGEKTSAIEKLRTCCGILDFSIRNNEILVANLGAFRVNGFDYSGKPTISFGQRGNGIDDFHGCCNPVSVAFLSNGGIVTVEKDPTRIKVYSKEGAKKVEGIEELVKGCAYIPMAVDTKDNVYLASKTGGLVKCIPTK